MTYLPIIGIEVHVELATKSKMFCGCPADYFGKAPNTNTCPVCLGLPGALPVPNKKAVEWTILLGLALGCQINKQSKFDRKNYFYPDLPKGYQVSQYDEPLCYAGKVKVGDKEIRITRVHLEEDTGKLQHTQIDGKRISLVDFNRSGVPLVEIVTEPDFRTIEEVDLFVKNLRRIIRYLGISQADMEKGSMRLEPSVSIKVGTDKNAERVLKTEDLPKYRVELKNINSFRFARKALEYEIKRQTELLGKGETPIQQTRGWSEEKSATLPQREKEEAQDYRYFPEPDIPPMRFTEAAIEEIRKQLPELPAAKLARFVNDYKISPYSASILVDDRLVAEYFEKTISDAEKATGTNLIKEIANWLVNKKFDTSTPPAELVRQIVASSQAASISDQDLDSLVDRLFNKHPQVVADYQGGKTGAINILIGIALKETKANKAIVIEKIKQKLEK